MSVEQSSELASRLRLVERPPAPMRMPPASLALRLKTSMWLRRLLPTRIVLGRAVRKGSVLWRESDWWRADALAAMAPVIAGTSSAQDLNEIAREYLIEHEAGIALFWQPWVRPRVDEQSELRLRQALGSGRGVLLSACHLGPYFQVSAALTHLGLEVYGVAGGWFLEQPTNDNWGRRLARWHKGLGKARIVPAKGAFPLVRALLERGECVVLFFDMPGHHETRFLGKPAMLADGSARLAIDSDALVLPMRLRRVGHRMGLDVGEALDPRRVGGAEELHEALAKLHERWILEFPAAMADPRSFGWGEGAGTNAWVMPDREAD